MHKALVQTSTDRTRRSLAQCAIDGFYLIGYEVETFTHEEWVTGKVEVTKDTVVSGFISTYLEALDRLQVPRPLNVDYPEELRPHFHRPIGATTVHAFRRYWSDCLSRKFDPDGGMGESERRLFIKPVHEHKAFTGKVVRQGHAEDLGCIASLPDDFPLWRCGAVWFKSEYRFFVYRGEVVGVGHYKGSPTVFPDGNTVRKMARQWTEAPVAWCLDVGVDQHGNTALVEVNDGHSMGDYGLYPALYARLLEARWCELTGKEPISPWHPT